MKISDEIVYVRFRYNIFPGFLISKFIHSKLQKIKKAMTEYDLLSNLSYRTWNMSKAVEKLAQIVNENDNLKNEIIQLKFKDKRELEMKLENMIQINMMIYAAEYVIFFQRGQLISCLQK